LTRRLGRCSDFGRAPWVGPRIAALPRIAAIITGGVCASVVFDW
jgi:hypothetical protein